jgi:hypothetical protein
MIPYKEIKAGDKVHYKTKHGEWQNGIVKTIPSHPFIEVFVVYNCAGEWDYYYQYTAQSTRLTDLHKGWLFNRKKLNITKKLLK